MQPVLVQVTEVGVPNTQALVRRARAGDTAAFDSLAAGLLTGAYRLAGVILGSEAEAADATQDALVAAWRALPRLRDPARFEPWFRRILVNECRMTIRRRSRSREVALDPSSAIDASAYPLAGATLETIEAVRALEAAFERLDPDDRILVALHHLDGRPLAEIAEIAHLPVGTVKWRLHEARAVLAGALEADR